ncbi:beta-lactamase/transpeptidase-like protein [Thozetella sp. PMI_491]|nr:beta-lactamase/transpeptidase-like protein [Thozetella sp. PMI_491]
MDGLNQILQSHVGTAGDTKDKLLGASFILLDRNGTIFEGGSGHQAFAPDSRPYGQDTVTWIASMTKLVTATAALQLVEKGVLRLDDDVRARIPILDKVQILRGFEEDGKPILEDNTNPISLRILLTHTTGFGYDMGEPEIMQWGAYTGRTVVNLNWSRDGFTYPLLFSPGESWMYGSSLDWVGQVIEDATGQRLSEYMEEHIFKPLGLQDTTFYPAKRPDLQERIADFGYRAEATQGSLAPGPTPVPADYEMESGGAGLYSTATDYAKVLAATLKGDVLLKKETTDLLFTPQLNDRQRKGMVDYVGRMPDAFCPEFPPGLPTDFAFGGMVNVEDVPDKRRKGSMMWSGFANAHWWIDRETGLAGVLVTTVLCDPPGDPVTIKLYHELEVAAYKNYAGSGSA